MRGESNSCKTRSFNVRSHISIFTHTHTHTHTHTLPHTLKHILCTLSLSPLHTPAGPVFPSFCAILHCTLHLPLGLATLAKEPRGHQHDGSSSHWCCDQDTQHSNGQHLQSATQHTHFIKISSCMFNKNVLIIVPQKSWKYTLQPYVVDITG